MIRAYTVILPTFFLALVFSIVPLPRLIDYVRPEFVAMTLVFWVLVSPTKAGIFLGLSMGLLYDVLHGQLLGQSALALCVLAYIGALMQSRMRLYNPLQQSFLVFVMVGLYVLMNFWIESIMGEASKQALLWPSVGSALVWPLWYNLLFVIRQFFRT